MNWISIVRTVLSLLPAIIDAIKAIEAAFPDAGQGAQKLSLIRGIIESISVEATEIWPYIEKTINTIVGFFNSNGTFKTTK